jgi:cobalt-zinc-cadmium efflux system protein
MAAEVVGGLLTGSLALLADAAHMVTDAGGLAAVGLVEDVSRHSEQHDRVGERRQDLKAHVTEALALLGVTAYILYEAYRRFVEPNEILGWPMMLVALVG